MARLLFFGRLADLAGARTRAFAAPAGGTSVAAVIDALAETEPALAAALKGPAIRYAVNEEIVGADAPVGADDDLAFLPPVSGG